ncbi:MAG: hypothetical protein R3E76_16315 [Planctomycetota bacterium]
MFVFGCSNQSQGNSADTPSLFNGVTTFGDADKSLLGGIERAIAAGAQPEDVRSYIADDPVRVYDWPLPPTAENRPFIALQEYDPTPERLVLTYEETKRIALWVRPGQGKQQDRYVMVGIRWDTNNVPHGFLAVTDYVER